MKTNFPGWVTCPVCQGTGKQQVAGDLAKFWPQYAGQGWMDCRNCGGQTMGGVAHGSVPVRPGTEVGCTHEYEGHQAGNCYRTYVCKHCHDRYSIDSGG